MAPGSYVKCLLFGQDADGRMADRDKPAHIPTVLGTFSPIPGRLRPGAPGPALGPGSCDRSPGRTARQTDTWGRAKQSLDDVSEMLEFITSPGVSRSPIIYIMSTNVLTALLVPVQLKAVVSCLITSEAFGRLASTLAAMGRALLAPTLKPGPSILPAPRSSGSNFPPPPPATFWRVAGQPT